jgi:uncharacterized membrane protein YfcA
VTPATYLLLFLAAAAAGAINSVAGGGTFVTFPALLSAGVQPLQANATSTIAVWPGAVAGAVAYRRELEGVRRMLLPLGIASLVGGAAGSILLLCTPEHTFVTLIPWLQLFATLLFSFGSALSKRITRGASAPLWMAFIGQLVIGVYAGYFGAGMSIMMLALLALLGMTHIHRMNALKNSLGTLANSAAVVLFILFGLVRWGPAVVMIAGAIAGGYGGASIARRVNAVHVRRLVLVIAWGMTGYFFWKTYVAPAAPKRVTHVDACMSTRA